MLTDIFSLKIAEQLNQLATVTEQGAFLNKVFTNIHRHAQVFAAEQLAVAMVQSRFTDNMPMATWPYAERYAAAVCHTYAQKVQSEAGETPEESAIPVSYEVGSAVVSRDARGFWRHPLYPLFSPDEPESRLAWFAENKLDGCGTYLVSPDEYDGSTSGNDNCSDWNAVRPAGDKWFLLAIEPTSNGPLALWAAKVGA